MTPRPGCGGPDVLAEVAAFAPGRVNLMGDHTDYAGGLALPVAIDLGTTVRGVRSSDRVELRSTDERDPVRLALPVREPSDVEPRWGRYVAGVVGEMPGAQGLVGTVTSTLPIGAGLSSSAALEVALALALGFDGPPMELARLAQRAEHRSSGVPCGLMDQLTSSCGVVGHALLIDFATETFAAVALPAGLDIVVVHSRQDRALAGSAYAERRASVESAIARLGPLRELTAAEVDAIADPVLRRRCRHVVTENERVHDLADAFASDDLTGIEELMAASQRSLRDDFGVSTDAVDDAVARLSAVPGVLGARLTGAGFGGCVVGLAHEGALTDPSAVTGRGWIVRASEGARLLAS